jgi:hypothetical protein
MSLPSVVHPVVPNRRLDRPSSATSPCACRAQRPLPSRTKQPTPLATLAILKYLRVSLSLGQHIGHTEAVTFYQVMRGNLTFMTARALFMSSVTVLSCMHALPPVMPFFLDIPMQAAYCLATALYISAPMADIFTQPRYAAGTQRLCSILSALPSRPAPGPPGPGSSPTAGPCGVQHVWVMMLFIQLFVGLVCPLYVSYNFERRLKLRFVQELKEQAQACSSAAPAPAAQLQPATSASFAARLFLNPIAANARAAHSLVASLFDRMHLGHRKAGVPMAACLLCSACIHACILGLLASVCWQLVTDLHLPLAHFVQLLTFPGASYQWYWQLVCNGDGPCCPA